MRKGVNYPRGLLEWGDAVGAGRIGAVLANLGVHYGEDRYRPAPRLTRAAQSDGRLPRMSAAGPPQGARLLLQEGGREAARAASLGRVS
jgi:3-hydroxyacyl-CoA dehydrogenase